MIGSRAALVVTILALLASIATQAQAADRWRLDGARSWLAFTTIKNGVVGEAHVMTDLRGAVGDDGAAEVVVALASVDTLIAVRDERMREMLFEVARHPEARLRLTVDVAALEALGVGETRVLSLSGELSLHGQVATLPLELTVVRTGAADVLVTTRRPALVSADAFDLAAGIEKLRAVASLQAIAPVVPVSVLLWFERVE
jgi:polyisoprenoid-binding protein YceI